MMGGGATAQTGKMTPQQAAAAANGMGRQALLRTGIPMSQIVWNGAALTLGAATRLDLLRVGITTGVMLDFTASVDIGTAAMVASLAGPWPLIPSITYTDFSGVNRVNTSALGLWLLSTFRHNKLFHFPNVGPTASTANEIGSTIGSIDTDILTFPTAVGAAEVIFFSVYMPMAYEPGSDLRGAVPSMVNVGQHYLTITPCNALVNLDQLLAPYSAVGASGTISLNSLTCTVTQFYIQPQSLAANMLPGIDLTTIYEINGNNITTSGFLTGAQNLINYPNDRSVMSAIFVYENGGVLTVNGADITLIELLVNSNTVFRQFTPRTYRGFMREMAMGDVISGAYYMPHRRQPILTNLYATVQLRLTLGTVAGSGTTKIVSQYESFYPSGQPLSGITPNAG